MVKMQKKLVCLDEETIAKATAAGNGNLSAGLRAGRYDEHSIIHATEKNLFVDIEQLINKYPNKHPDFIRKLVEVATTVREPIKNVVARYLEGQKNIAISEEMQTAYKEATNEEIDNQQRQSYGAGREIDKDQRQRPKTETETEN